MLERLGTAVLCLVILAAGGCSRDSAQQETAAPGSLLAAGETLVADFALENLKGVISRKYLSFDPEVSSDGQGSLRIDALKPWTLKLFELGDLDLQDTRLIYRARVRSEKLAGSAYLEMLVSIPGLGHYYSRGFDTAVHGTHDWLIMQTPFFLSKGQDPNNIKLNLVVTGAGTVWVDEVLLAKAPMHR